MRIHHLALRTRQLETLERFYVALGLEPVRRQPGYSVWLRAGDVVLMIERAEPEEPPPDPESRDLLAFGVDARGLEHVEAELGAGGVRIEDRTAHTLYFRDPDGRRVGVSDYRFDGLASTAGDG